MAEQIEVELDDIDLVRVVFCDPHGLARSKTVPASVFRRASLAYELAYGKGLTPFLRLARDSGVERVCDGVGMLVEQAAEAFAWWRGVRPGTRDMIQKLTVPLK